MTPQVDHTYRVRYELRGGHFHCTLFSRRLTSSTWQNCGDLVVDEEQWLAFTRLMSGAEFVERQR